MIRKMIASPFFGIVGILVVSGVAIFGLWHSARSFGIGQLFFLEFAFYAALIGIHVYAYFRQARIRRLETEDEAKACEKAWGQRKPEAGVWPPPPMPPGP